MTKEIRQLMRKYSKIGWKIHTTGSGHLKFENPMGGFVYTASSPSGHRALKNIEKRLKHCAEGRPI